MSAYVERMRAVLDRVSPENRAKLEASLRRTYASMERDLPLVKLCYRRALGERLPLDEVIGTVLDRILGDGDDGE
jgi:hypothetical protein